jgi:hypothetical protein
MAWCPQVAEGQANGISVTLSAISISTGRTVATQSVQLPQNASPSSACVWQGGQVSDQEVRQMFDRTFTNMAVTVTDPSIGATLATAVNMQTGNLFPTASPQGFGSAPQQANAVFDVTGEDLWYADSANSEIISRDLQSGSTVVRGHSSGDAVAVSHGNFWPLSSSDDWAVAPDGSHIIASDQTGMYLAGPNADLSNFAGGIGSGSTPVTSIGTSSTFAPVLPGSDPTDCNTPAAWIDSTSLLCYADGNLAVITFSQGLTSVTSMQKNLLPQSNLTNPSAVMSPDGKSFAFIAEQGTTATLYVQALTPGSIPVKIAVVPSAGTSPFGYAPLLLQWN